MTCTAIALSVGAALNILGLVASFECCTELTSENHHLDGSVIGMHANAKMNARAPIDPTSAWPMWIQLLMRSVSGVMSGPAARKSMRTSSRFARRLEVDRADRNPGC